jgi:hypothetical protein
MGKGKSANMSKSTKLVLFCAVFALVLILWNSGVVVVPKTYGPLGAPSVFNKEMSEVEIDALPKSDFR